MAAKEEKLVEILAIENCGSCGRAIDKGSRALVPKSDAKALVDGQEAVYVHAADAKAK